jgi:hypothetical protein
LVAVSYLRGLGVKYYEDHYFGYDVVYLFGLTTTYFYATILNESLISYVFILMVSMLSLAAYILSFNIGIYDSKFLEESESVVLEKPNQG